MRRPVWKPEEVVVIVIVIILLVLARMAVDDTADAEELTPWVWLPLVPCATSTPGAAPTARPTPTAMPTVRPTPTVE